MQQKRRKIRFGAVVLILAALLLSAGCRGEKPVLENTGEGYAPSALAEYGGNEGRIAEDDRFYYLLTDFRLYLIDKNTWEVQKACRDAMCAHEGTCAYSGMPEYVINVNGNILLTYKNMLGYFNENVIYRLNPVTLQLDEVYESESMMGSLKNYEDQLAYNWIDQETSKSGTCLLNPWTGECTELSDKAARVRYDDSYFYLNTVNDGGLYRLSRDLQDMKLLDSNQVSAVQLDGDYLYYTYYDSEYAAVTLGRMAKDTQEVEMLVPDVWNWFHVYQGKVYYTDQKADDLLVLNLDTGESRVLAEKVSLMFYLIPGEDKLIINQDGTYSCMNLDGSGLKELLYESSEFSYR